MAAHTGTAVQWQRAPAFPILEEELEKQLGRETQRLSVLRGKPCSPQHGSCCASEGVTCARCIVLWTGPASPALHHFLQRELPCSFYAARASFPHSRSCWSLYGLRYERSKSFITGPHKTDLRSQGSFFSVLSYFTIPPTPTPLLFF